MLIFGVEELRVHHEGTLEVEALDVQDVLDIDFGLLAALDGGEGVDGLDALLDADQIFLLNEIDLVQQDAVGEGELLDGLILRALRLLLIKMLLHMLRINERNDPIKPRELLHFFINKKGLSDGRGVGHTGGLNDNAIKLQATLGDAVTQLLQDNDEILTHGTADAAVHHLDELLLGLHLGVLLEEIIIDTNLTELVLNDGQLLTVVLIKTIKNKLKRME